MLRHSDGGAGFRKCKDLVTTALNVRILVFFRGRLRYKLKAKNFGLKMILYDELELHAP